MIVLVNGEVSATNVRSRNYNAVFEADGERLCAVASADSPTQRYSVAARSVAECARSCISYSDCIAFNVYDNACTCDLITCQSFGRFLAIDSCRAFLDVEYGYMQFLGFSCSTNGMSNCYYVDNLPLSWDEASAKCNRLHPEAHLAVINSALEDQVISRILEKHECPIGGWNGWFWIGGRRTFENCTSPFQWRPTNNGTYQPLGYTNYCPMEPDCNPSSPQYCLSAVKDCWARRNTYGWQDDACNKQRCAICEMLKCA